MSEQVKFNTDTAPRAGFGDGHIAVAITQGLFVGAGFMAISILTINQIFGHN